MSIKTKKHIIGKTKNLLVRDGVSQSGRSLKALHPNYARVDDRSLADFLNLASGYAAKLQYFDGQNKPDGNWKDFFERDIASVIAIVEKKNVDPYKNLLAKHKNFVNKASSASSLKRSGSVKSLFEIILLIVSEINEWYVRAIADDKFRRHLDRLISSKLRSELENILAAYKYCINRPWYESQNVPNLPRLNVDLDSILAKPLSGLWTEDVEVEANTLQQWVDQVDASNDIFGDTSDSFYNTQVALMAILNWADLFLKDQIQIINDSPDYLYAAVNEWPHHKPHITLYLTFIRLFRYLQVHINNITDRHLEYYYQTILGFKLKPATRDKVHVLFELAKQKSEFLLEKGTKFKAGFDAEGLPVTYEFLEDLVINKASIKDSGDVKSIYIDRNTGEGYRVYSADVANSADGKGKEFEDTPKWKPFGETQVEEGKFIDEDSKTMDAASLGFSVSSSILELSEGERTITLTLPYTGTITRTLDTKFVRVRLSSEKDWIIPTISDFSADTGDSEITLVVALDETEDPVTAFPEELQIEHGYKSSYPVLEVTLVHEEDEEYLYNELKSVKFSSVTVEVDVVGATDLIVQNDLGVQDVNKPFQAFGSIPVLGNSFYIGSKEAFSKPVNKMNFEINWLNKPTSFSTHYQVYNDVLGTSFNDDSFTIKVSTLTEKTWNEKTVSSKYIFKEPTGTYTEKPDFDLIFPTSSAYFFHNPTLAEFKKFTKDLQQGFVRCELDGPSDAFGHKLYSKVYADRIIAMTNPKIISTADTDGDGIGDITYETVTLPNEPYVPTIKSIKMNYTASLTLSAETLDSFTEDGVFHVFPFGKQKLESNTTDKKISLLPQFTVNVAGKVQEENGSLLIGLSDAKASQSVSLFFQVAEGSADPELNKENIYWSILNGNTWELIDDEDIIIDTINSFNASGIVSIQLPSELNTDSTILESGKVWIKASILKNTAAVCDLIEVGTQVGVASFYDEENDPGFLATKLPAGTIGKLVEKKSAIKTITQPYSSEEGVATESVNKFNVRVSERLRHKGRAINIWDYERMVLEEFPEIYKAKCINHSTYLFEKKDGSLLTSEFAPGYVSLIVIPDLKNKNAINPVEPRASLDLLDKIKSYLKLRMPAFPAEKLRVINPEYEKIHVSFDIFFHDGYDDSYYKKVLIEDIKQFLSPWAFESAEGQDLTFGGKLHRSVVANFVEERPYVDYFTNFKMNHYTVEKKNIDVEEAKPTTARSIFVSDDTHTIAIGKVC